MRQHFKARRTLEPQTHRCGRKTLLTARRRERLQTLVAQQPDATLAELGAQFRRPTSTMDLWLARLGLSCKKTLPAAEQSRPDGVEQRRRRPQRLAGVPASQLVFVDESGANSS